MRNASQQSRDTVRIPFQFMVGSTTISTDHAENQASLDKLRELVRTDIAHIESIHVIGAYSPEGSLVSNEALSYRRALAVKNWLIKACPEYNKTIYLSDPRNMILVWQQLVEQDEQMPSRDKVLEILGSDKTIQEKWALIRPLPERAATYMEQNIFPSLRSASCFVTIVHDAPAAAPEVIYKETIIEAKPDTLTIYKERIDTIKLAADTIRVKADTVFMVDTTRTVTPVEQANKLMFAVKTNLLFDAASLLNLEVEVPIGNKWSIALEWIGPWWLWGDKQNCLQMHSGNIEGRYWFGNREQRPLLTGWYAGIYAGGGYYDLEWNKTGYQGEFFLAVGIGGGYSHTIGKNFRMEYSLGIGYLSTHYREYEAVKHEDEWRLMRRGTGTYSWFGPTRARVSLVWVFNGKTKKGGK